MNELSYSNKHFASGTYRGTVTTPEKVTVPLMATLHFDVEKGTVTGEFEDHESGKLEVTGTFNNSPPYDFKLNKADTTYNGFRQNENLIGRYKNAGGKGMFQLKPHNIIAPAKLTEEKDMSQEETIQELLGMGFGEESVREAVIVKGLSLSEAAEQLVNPDEENASPEVLIERFRGMGFNDDKIAVAVEACNGKEEVALSMLLESQE